MQEETRFGSHVEPVNETQLQRSPTDGITVNQERRLPDGAPVATVAAGRRRLREDKAPVQMVSKQSRPFLMLKVVQFVFAGVCLLLGSTTWPVMLIRGNILLAMQPLIGALTFILYCPVCVCGYIAGHPTPATAMLFMDVLGAAHFTLSAIMCGVYWAELEFLLGNKNHMAPPFRDLERISMALAAVSPDTDVHLAADKLLLETLLSSSAATLFLGDVFITMKYLVLRSLPPTNKHLPLI